MENNNRIQFNEQLRQYKDGKQLPSMDEFDQEALEGWSEQGFTAVNMTHLDQRVSFSTSSGSWGIAATIVIIGGLFIATTLFSPSFKAENTTTMAFDKEEIELPAHIDTMQVLTYTDQLTVADLKSFNEDRQDKKPSELTQTVTITDKIVQLAEPILEPLTISTIEQPKLTSTKKNAKEIYLKDLKAIDYSEYRNKPTVQIERIVMTGLPATYEGYESVEHEQSFETVAVPYMDYLEKTLELIQKRKFKQALSRCEDILASYPDDVNGQFYAGFCSYNLKQYHQASEHFSNCLQLQFANFNEEATWYLALSKKANGEFPAAKELMELIKAEKGFYAKQAEKELKSLK